MQFLEASRPGWMSLPMRFHFDGGNNKYSNKFHAGDCVQYYFTVDYTDRQTASFTAPRLGITVACQERTSNLYTKE